MEEQILTARNEVEDIKCCWLVNVIRNRGGLEYLIVLKQGMRSKSIA